MGVALAAVASGVALPALLTANDMAKTQWIALSSCIEDLSKIPLTLRIKSAGSSLPD